MQGLDLNLFFFAKKFDHLTISNKCRDFGRCFGLNLFENFFEKLRSFEISIIGRKYKSGCLPTTGTSSNILVWFGRDASEKGVAGLRESLISSPFAKFARD
jgi:hypothetical protein